MKHYRPISRTPAVATTALGAKIEFKTTLSTMTADSINVLTHNIGLNAQALLVNSLNIGQFIEVLVDNILPAGSTTTGGGTDTGGGFGG